MTDKELKQDRVVITVIPTCHPNKFTLLLDGQILIEKVTSKQGTFFMKGFQKAKPNLQGLAIESKVVHAIHN